MDPDYRKDSLTIMKIPKAMIFYNLFQFVRPSVTDSSYHSVETNHNIQIENGNLRKMDFLNLHLYMVSTYLQISFPTK